MPVAVTYPGVYIEEVSSGVRTITGVSTSIAAFVDSFASGPLDKAVEIFSFPDFQSRFGGLAKNSEASYAIQQFFLNGGSHAYVVRVTSADPANAAKAAAIDIQDVPGGKNLLTATALDPGALGNDIRLDVDRNTADNNAFNLTVTRIATAADGSTSVVAAESYPNLVVDDTKPNDAVTVVNRTSKLIQLTKIAKGRPAETGTTSKVPLGLGQGPFAGTKGEQLDVTLGGTALGKTAGLPADAGSLAELAAGVQNLLRGPLDGDNKIHLPNATATIVGSGANAYIAVKSGAAAEKVLGLGGALGTTLSIAPATENVQQYALGGTAAGAQALPGGNRQQGSDGAWDDKSANAAGMTNGLLGDAGKKTGMYALQDVDLFNILCIPATMLLPDNDAAQVASQAESLCKAHRAMYILDVPQAEHNRDKPDAVETWMSANGQLRDRNAALYFPRLQIADPLDGFRLRTVSPSGTLAGVWAATDGNRGVWKAPAGTDAQLGGVQALAYKLTDGENGALNPLAINALRTFPVFGPVSWGARTLRGADQLVDEYKYIPVRRLALFLEESLFRGTQWVVFEPNDAPLWSQIRLNVGAFMQTLFRQGAFAGTTPADAYFVHCDDKTNPQATIDLGIVNVVVGFAPLKPAEFVVIQIQQIAGQLAS